jgi:hypothetical protein
MGHGVLPVHQQGHAELYLASWGLAWNSLARTSRLYIYTLVQLRSRAVMRLKNGLPKVILVQPKCVLVRAKRGRRAPSPTRVRAPGLFSLSPLWSGLAEERGRTAAGSRKRIY